MNKQFYKEHGFIATLEIPGPPFPENLHNKKFCAIVWCYTGDLDKAESAFKPVMAQNPFYEHVGPISYSGLIKTLFLQNR